MRSKKFNLLFTAVFACINVTMLSVAIVAHEGKGVTMDYSGALQKLQSLGEEHLFDAWQQFDEQQQQKLLNDIALIDQETFRAQQKTVQENVQAKLDNTVNYQAFKDYIHAGTSYQFLGQQLIVEGRVGCLLVAGGQGTRLSHKAPKGTFPVSNVTSKSLFQLFAEKVKAAGVLAKRPLQLAIMTSPKNHAETLAFFQAHDNFGLEDGQLHFFTQTELPFLDVQGHLLLQTDGSLAKGPDGNGYALAAFKDSGLWDLWQQQGIEYLSFNLVDNPLGEPFDAELVGFHSQNDCEMTIKCVEKSFPEERVGLIVATENGPRIAEYSEMPESERLALLEDGLLKHRCANISLFCLSMDFVNKASSKTLPWHLAYKAIQAGGPFAWKFESFIFDIMAYEPKLKAVLYPREQIFAPLKNDSGQDSLQTVQSALLKRDCAILAEICGGPVETGMIELDQQFYYPTDELFAAWKGRQGPFIGYIDAKID